MKTVDYNENINKNSNFFDINPLELKTKIAELEKKFEAIQKPHIRILFIFIHYRK